MSQLINNLETRLSRPVRIAFPEGNNPKIRQAANLAADKNLIEPIYGDDFDTSAKLVTDGKADGLVAGIDLTSRQVILGARDHFGLQPGLKTFSSCFLMDLPNGQVITLADCATCKRPTAQQLTDIVLSTAATVHQVLQVEPKVALLSFSTHGSGGHDDSIDLIAETLKSVKAKSPQLAVDGELQLDAALLPAIASKKAPDSPLKGQANVLICPDINSGNILYKAVEHLAGAHAYGPILQGFAKPVNDLSRGSSVEDIYGVILVTAVLAQLD
jgi:phosphate acetyltransferase